MSKQIIINGKYIGQFNERMLESRENGVVEGTVRYLNDCYYVATHVKRRLVRKDEVLWSKLDD